MIVDCGARTTDKYEIVPFLLNVMPGKLDKSVFSSVWLKKLRFPIKYLVFA